MSLRAIFAGIKLQRADLPKLSVGGNTEQLVDLHRTDHSQSYHRRKPTSTT